MTSLTSEASIGMQPNQTKEKRTRRRQRVSCVECTNRRQKCDRQHPCGLCVSRGVAHLCHWASWPVSRPAPARPPTVPNLSDQASQADLLATIKALSERLANLERTIGSNSTTLSIAASSDRRSPPPDSTSISTLNARAPDTAIGNVLEDEEVPPLAPLQQDVHEAAVTLAQLSLAHHGEYVGSGSILCALHKLGNPANVHLAYPKSTESTVTTPQHLTNVLNPVQLLAAQGLPSRQAADAMIPVFFTECNWRYGIPEKWFYTAYSRMWRALDAGGVCMSSCEEQINVHWLSLLFAVLAFTPPGVPGAESVSREACFMHALNARRLADDALLISPPWSTGSSAADGTVLGCFAVVLLSSYVAARGRVSEAWKLVGGAIRAGQAAGMHRDPGWVKWKDMCNDERVLRCRGWWSLVVCDQLYSCVLGRPSMTHEEVMDVPPPSLKYSDASEDPPFDTYQAMLVELCRIVGRAGLEVGDECAGPQPPPYATVLEFDRRYEDWFKNLPTEFRWHPTPQTTPISRAELMRSRQRHNLGIWYLACRMNLHRPWLTRATPPVLPLPVGLVESQVVVLNPSREKCITLAMELVHMQCAYTRWATEVSQFSRTFFIFDGAVTLISALAYMPNHPSASRCIETVERAMASLQEARKSVEQGEIARRATEVLEVLKRAGGWAGRINKHHQGSSGVKGNDTAESSFEKDNLTPGTISKHYENIISHVRTEPASQPFIPFTDSNPATVSANWDLYNSHPSGETLVPGARNKEHTTLPNQDKVWSSSDGLNSVTNGTSQLDVHMMMPIEMLQRVQMDGFWGYNN